MKTISYIVGTLLFASVFFLTTTTVRSSRAAEIQVQESLIIACKTLKTGIDERPASQTYDLLILANAYRTLRKDVSAANAHRLADEDRYIQALIDNNKSTEVNAVITFAYNPLTIPGWRHHEVNTLIKAIGGGLNIDDIGTTMKLKESLDIKLLQQSLEVKQKP